MKPMFKRYPAASIFTMSRFLFAVQLALLCLAAVVRTNPISGCFDGNPADAVATTEHNTTALTSQANILQGRSDSDMLNTRQASCPNPSTNSLCNSGFCFIYQQNGDGTAWATCCAAGWSLSLNRADWTTQKCILNGVSEPPVRPVSCGGNINGASGTFSGWACAYSNQNVNGVGTATWSTLLMVALALSWFVLSLS